MENLDQQNPLSNLRKTLSENSLLVFAHGGLIEGESTSKKWEPDTQSIFTKSAFILICSIWEVFIEDSAAAASKHLIDNVSCVENIPKSVRKKAAEKLKKDKNDLAVWALAQNGWRDVIRDIFDEHTQRKINLLNSPSPDNVRTLFSDTVGIPDITKCWEWSYFPVESTTSWIKKFIEARGAIAHGRDPSFGIGIFALEFFRSFVDEASCKTHNRIREFLLETTSKEIWPAIQNETDWFRFKAFEKSMPLLDEVYIFRDKDRRPHYAVHEKYLDYLQSPSREGSNRVAGSINAPRPHTTGHTGP